MKNYLEKSNHDWLNSKIFLKNKRKPSKLRVLKLSNEKKNSFFYFINWYFSYKVIQIGIRISLKLKPIDFEGRREVDQTCFWRKHIWIKEAISYGSLNSTPLSKREVIKFICFLLKANLWKEEVFWSPSLSHEILAFYF